LKKFKPVWLVFVLQSSKGVVILVRKNNFFVVVKLVCMGVMFAAFFVGCNNSGNDGRPRHAIVVKSQSNSYFERIIEGFTAVVEQQGAAAIVKAPSRATAEEQITIINSLITDGVDSISIATNSESALAPVLSRAIEQGIKVQSFDSAAYPASRALHVNQADAKIIARTLMDAAADITGGSGQIAIMSTTTQANNQNRWIAAMRALLEAGEYPGLMLVSIVYGKDDYDITYERTQFLIDTFPELVLIIAPTAAGIPAVAACITNNGVEYRLRVTGLGMPSQMAQFIGADKACPYMFLWDLDEVGKLTAYSAIALVDGAISGEVGERLTAGEMGEYFITSDPFGGSEIVLQAMPIRFDESNIGYWKEIY